jgi:glucosyl-3-phosphoglycerate synthase
MTVERWLAERSHHHSEFPAERLAAERRHAVSICLPTRETADTIGPNVETLVKLRDSGVVDQVLVIDAGSQDGTAEIAARAGAETHQEADLLPELGPVLGKGDAMWRSLTVTTGDVVCFLDADTPNLPEHFACGLLGPLLCGDDVEFVKGHFRRPLRIGDAELPEGGGRVTELTARPLLNMFHPQLAGFRQPLAGEIAGRRELLERLPWATGYAVEIAMLIDVHGEVGLDAMAQVDLEERRNRHQPLDRLGRMAYAVLLAVATRLEREGRLAGPLPTTLLAPSDGGMVRTDLPLVERPPMASVRAGA